MSIFASKVQKFPDFFISRKLKQIAIDKKEIHKLLIFVNINFKFMFLLVFLRLMFYMKQLLKD